MYSDFNKNAEIRYKEGDISYLDLLNAKAKQAQISTMMSEIKYELEIAYQSLQAIMQYKDTFVVPVQDLVLIPLKKTNPENDPGLQLVQMQTDYQKAMLTLERKNLLPDISVGYYLGTNQYDGAEKYHGFQVGIAVPLFFSGKKAKINAQKIAIDINEKLVLNYKMTLQAKEKQLYSELSKCEEALNLYESSGKMLSQEIIRSSTTAYEMGEIDFLEFVMSLENALALHINYLENTLQYNQTMLEINYLTQ